MDLVFDGCPLQVSEEDHNQIIYTLVTHLIEDAIYCVDPSHATFKRDLER
jgi:hypothetical protein